MRCVCAMYIKTVKIQEERKEEKKMQKDIKGLEE